jgi:hypothetical protein
VQESEDQTRLTQTRIDELQWTLDQMALSREASDYLQAWAPSLLQLFLEQSLIGCFYIFIFLLLEQNIKKRDEKQKAQAEHIASLREKKKALAKALFTANADLVKYLTFFSFHLIFIDRLLALWPYI